jgi:RNA polymerase sigma-70 factor (ECF subfamily)
VPNHEDASDLSQEVFLRAFRALHKFRGQASLGTWLYRIGVNVCLNRLSLKTPRHEPLDEQAQVDTESESPPDRILRAERQVRVRLAVARLPAKQRAALVLRVYQEMSHQEIAKSLGTSVGAAKANVFHALRNLKRLLGGEEG